MNGKGKERRPLISSKVPQTGGGTAKSDLASLLRCQSKSIENVTKLYSPRRAEINSPGWKLKTQAQILLGDSKDSRSILSHKNSKENIDGSLDNHLNNSYSRVKEYLSRINSDKKENRETESKGNSFCHSKANSPLGRRSVMSSALNYSPKELLNSEKPLRIDACIDRIVKHKLVKERTLMSEPDEERGSMPARLQATRNSASIKDRLRNNVIDEAERKLLFLLNLFSIPDPESIAMKSFGKFSTAVVQANESTTALFLNVISSLETDNTRLKKLFQEASRHQQKTEAKTSEAITSYEDMIAYLTEQQAQLQSLVAEKEQLLADLNVCNCQVKTDKNKIIHESSRSSVNTIMKKQEDSKDYINRVKQNLPSFKCQSKVIIERLCDSISLFQEEFAEELNYLRTVHQTERSLLQQRIKMLEASLESLKLFHQDSTQGSVIEDIMKQLESLTKDNSLLRQKLFDLKCLREENDRGILQISSSRRIGSAKSIDMKAIGDIDIRVHKRKHLDELEASLKKKAAELEFKEKEILTKTHQNEEWAISAMNKINAKIEEVTHFETSLETKERGLKEIEERIAFQSEELEYKLLELQQSRSKGQNTPTTQGKVNSQSEDDMAIFKTQLLEKEEEIKQLQMKLHKEELEKETMSLELFKLQEDLYEMQQNQNRREGTPTSTCRGELPKVSHFCKPKTQAELNTLNQRSLFSSILLSSDPKHKIDQQVRQDHYTPTVQLPIPQAHHSNHSSPADPSYPSFSPYYNHRPNYPNS